MSLVKRHRAYKFRVFPNETQIDKIQINIDCARFAFNKYLSERNETYKQTGETLSWQTFKIELDAWKKHNYLSFLKKADKFAIEQGILQVQDAFERFFKGQTRFPKFKKKRASKQSYTTCFTNNNIKFLVDEQCIQLPKVGKIPFKMSNNERLHLMKNGLDGIIKKVTVSKHSSGAYYVSLMVEKEIKKQEKIDIDSISDDRIIGLDLGLTHFAITSHGEKFDNPKFYHKQQKKLKKLQRKLKNKKFLSQNYKKQQTRISKLQLKIAHTRHNFLHQISRQLINENQVIILEDLHVKNMIKNKKLSKSIQDVGWGLFKTFLTYKAEWENKHLVLVDTFFPSSKLCFGCGEKNILLSLNDRTWICPSCGCEHDRDVNAANNIKREGLRLLMEKEIV